MFIRERCKIPHFMEKRQHLVNHMFKAYNSQFQVVTETHTFLYEIQRIPILFSKAFTIIFPGEIRRNFIFLRGKLHAIFICEILSYMPHLATFCAHVSMRHSENSIFRNGILSTERNLQMKHHKIWRYKGTASCSPPGENTSQPFVSP